LKALKRFFWISFIAGFTIFLNSLYLKVANTFSDGCIAGRYGDIRYGKITWYSGMFIGILILLLSFWAYRGFITEKKKYDKMELLG